MLTDRKRDGLLLALGAAAGAIVGIWWRNRSARREIAALQTEVSALSRKLYAQRLVQAPSPLVGTHKAVAADTPPAAPRLQPRPATDASWLDVGDSGSSSSEPTINPGDPPPSPGNCPPDLLTARDNLLRKEWAAIRYKTLSFEDWKKSEGWAAAHPNDGRDDPEI